jgi:DNA topoisomerase-2
VCEEDFAVLKYRDDDGLPVEPEWYAPILPMLLINGSRGIGTGYSTYIPPCDPKVIKKMLVNKLKNGTPLNSEKIIPYFEGFKGTYTEEGVVGVFKKEKDEHVITELPPGTWTADYREWLEKELAEGRIKDFTDTSTDQQIHIRIKGVDEPTLVKSLTEKIRMTNMHAFNHKGIITKYDTLNDILHEFYDVRLDLYEKRRQHQLKVISEKLPYHDNVVRFIKDQISDKPKVVLKKKSLKECDEILKQNQYELINDSYDYILSLPVSAFTLEKIKKHEDDRIHLKVQQEDLEKTNASQLWLADLEVV